MWIYVFLATIVLVNLLIAQMSGVYEKISDDATQVGALEPCLGNLLPSFGRDRSSLHPVALSLCSHIALTKPHLVLSLNGSTGLTHSALRPFGSTRTYARLQRP